MNTLIVGGGKIVYFLAKAFSSKGYSVTIINRKEDECGWLARRLKATVVFGNATEPQILREAQTSSMDAVLAVTPNDEDNLATCYVARKMFNVPRTIARINNPRNAWLFDDKFHIDVALNHSEVMARLIEEEMSMGDMVTLVKLRRGDYSLVEEKIPVGAKAIGAAIKDLQIPDECVIAAIIREGKVVMPHGNTTFQAGDEVLAVTNRRGADGLAALFASPSRPRSAAE